MEGPAEKLNTLFILITYPFKRCAEFAERNGGFCKNGEINVKKYRCA